MREEFFTMKNLPVIFEEEESFEEEVELEQERYESFSDDEFPEEFDPKAINIISKQDTLRNILDRLKNNEIDLNTDFQRGMDLWNNIKMSRLIESILIRFPLPAFYFDATNDEKWLVVDGLQRLSSIRKFVVEKEPYKRLRLKGLEFLGKELSGKTYDELSRTYKRRLDECPITLFLIQPGTPDKVKYSIFKRINTGGLTLNFQEIRNALTSDAVRKYLKRLSEDDYMRKTFVSKFKRMQGQELVLRFLAFYAMDYQESKKNITVFLDEMMETMERMNASELESLETAFRTAIKRSWDIFGETAFEKINPSSSTKRRRKNPVLFEVWTTSLAKLSEDETKILIAKKEILKEKHTELITKSGQENTTKNDYFQSITYSTQTRDSYRIRCTKVKELINEVLNA
jgi:hypothetical protein